MAAILRGASKGGILGLLFVGWLLAGCGGDGGSSSTASGGLATVTAPEITVPAGQAGRGGERTSTAAATTTTPSEGPAPTTDAAKPAGKLPAGKKQPKSPPLSTAQLQRVCEGKASSYPPVQRAQVLADCLNPPPASSQQPALPPGKHP